MDSAKMFNNVRIFLKGGIPPSSTQIKIIERNVKKRGGSLVESIVDATHLVLLKDKPFTSYNNLIKSLNIEKLPENVKLVHEDWLSNCSEKEFCIPENEFEVRFDESNETTPPTKKTKLNEINDEHKDYAIILMVEDGEDHKAYLKRCQEAIPVEDQEMRLCFQMDDTRHITLAKGSWTDEEALSIKFKPLTIIADLPITLTLSDPHNWCRNSVFALKIDDALLRERVCKLVEKLEDLPAGRTTKTTEKSLHLSLYRNRGTIEENKFQKFVKQLKDMHKQPGQVKGVRLVVKLIGGEYTEGRVIV